jgi:hypothetical protein
MLTADTITDAQIRELARGKRTPAQQADCALALKKRDRSWTRVQRNSQLYARTRCAALFNVLAARPQCDFRDAHDPVTDTPLGERCGAPATHYIMWDDGRRYSVACDQHLEIDSTATVKPTSIVPLAPKESLVPTADARRKKAP